MKTDIYNKNGEVAGMIDLPDRVFGSGWNPDLVHQALLTQLINKRKPIAHTKNRGEVRGGGIKPWRQKHTGRARHGSIRSPIWRGGGITFGPRRDKIYEAKTNKKMRQKAIFSAISRRLSEGTVKVVDSFDIDRPKTKDLAGLLRAFIKNRGSSLLIYGQKNENFNRASRNLKNTKSLSAGSLNIYDILKYKHILIEKNAVEVMDKHYTSH